MLISPASGCSKPAMRRRQVVLPEPDGPSMEKNSPGRMSRSRSSTALTAPKWRATPRKRTALPFADATGWAATASCGRVCTDMTGAPEVSSASLSRGGARPVAGAPARGGLPPAQDGDVVGHPAVIGHAAFRLAGAFGHRRAPELDLVEIAHAVGLAALGTEQLVALAGGRHGRHRAEPGGEVALHLRADGMFEPQIGAVRVRRVHMHPGGVGPARRALFRNGAADGLVLALEQVDLERPGRGGDHALVGEV